MQAALKELRITHNLEKIASMGVSWAEFNEIVGHTAWRRLELETFSDAALKEKYGSSDIKEITWRETEAGKMWKQRLEAVDLPIFLFEIGDEGLDREVLPRDLLDEVGWVV